MEGEGNVTPENSNSDEFEQLTVTSTSQDTEINRQLKISQLEEQLIKNAETYARENHLLSEQVKDLTEKLNLDNEVIHEDREDLKASVRTLTEKLKISREELRCCENERNEALKNVELSQQEISVLINDVKIANEKSQKLKNAIVRKTKETIEAKQQSSEAMQTISSLTETVERLKTELEESKMELTFTLSTHQKSLELAESEKVEAFKSFQHYQRLYESTLAELTRQSSHRDTLQTEFENYKNRSKLILEQQLTAIVDEKRSAGENERIKLLESQIGDLRNALECSQLNLQTSKNSLAAVCMRFVLLKKQVGGLFKLLTSATIGGLDKLNEKLTKTSSHLKRCFDTLMSEYRLAHSRDMLKINDLLVKLALQDEINAKINARMKESPAYELSDSKKTSFDTEVSMNDETPKKSHASPGTRVLQEIVAESPGDKNMRVFGKKSKSEIDNLKELLSESKRDELLMTNQLSLMKEEIRRMGLAIERNSNISNMEYLKNIIFKFVTFPHGDQKMTLVSVIQSMLNFTEEEIAVLESIATGRSIEVTDGWGSYLYGFIDSGIKYIRP